MSFDPMNPPPPRPRSTPIPDGSGSALPPPTPSQFLNDQPQQLPWTPQPGYDVNARMGFSAGSGLASGRSSFRPVVFMIVIIMLAISAGVGWYIYKQASDAVDDAVERSSEQPLSTLQVSIPSFTVPTFTVPTIPQIVPPVTAVPATIGPNTADPPTVPVATLSTVAQETTTLPTPPPTVLPTPPPTPTFLPNGATTVFGDGAPRFVADQLDLGLAGEPTQFTEIALFPDYALATAQDPANPSQIIAAQWIDGQVNPAEVTSTGSPGDLSVELFTGGDVNWEAITSLVAYAPAVLNLPDGHVSVIYVDRVGRGNPPPVVIDVYVEGSGGKGHVVASASGEILSSGPL